MLEIEPRSFCIPCMCSANEVYSPFPIFSLALQPRKRVGLKKTETIQTLLNLGRSYGRFRSMVHITIRSENPSWRNVSAHTRPAGPMKEERPVNYAFSSIVPLKLCDIHFVPISPKENLGIVVWWCYWKMSMKHRERLTVNQFLQSRLAPYEAMKLWLVG